MRAKPAKPVTKLELAKAIKAAAKADEAKDRKEFVAKARGVGGKPK